MPVDPKKCPHHELLRPFAEMRLVECEACGHVMRTFSLRDQAQWQRFIREQRRLRGA